MALVGVELEMLVFEPDAQTILFYEGFQFVQMQELTAKYLIMRFVLDCHGQHC